MIRAPIPRPHWKHCALCAFLFGTALHFAERCLAGAIMTGGM